MRPTARRTATRRSCHQPRPHAPTLNRLARLGLWQWHHLLSQARAQALALHRRPGPHRGRHNGRGGAGARRRRRRQRGGRGGTKGPGGRLVAATSMSMATSTAIGLAAFPILLVDIDGHLAQQRAGKGGRVDPIEHRLTPPVIEIAQRLAQERIAIDNLCTAAATHTVRGRGGVHTRFHSESQKRVHSAHTRTRRAGESRGGRCIACEEGPLLVGRHPPSLRPR